MELLVREGDLALDRQGAPIPLDGAAALLQRAAIRLGVRRGTVPGDPTLGSNLHRLKASATRQTLEARVLAAVREALAPIGEVGVRTVRCSYDPEAARLEIQLTLEAYGRDWNLEVTV